MNKMIPERLAKLREQMKKRGITLYVVPTSDFHESEYVGEHFKARKFITGFTGSAGTAVITMDEAGLWTDGRYFVQAAKQLQGTTVTLYKSGEEGVPTIEEYMEKTLKEGDCIGFDGRVVNDAWGNELAKIAQKKKATMYVKEDLIDCIWEDRPAMPHEEAYILEEKYTGRSVSDKIKAVREEMEKQKADLHLLSSLYDIAWLLNVRGNDISYVPVVLSFLAMTKEQCIWFVQEEAINDTVRAYLIQNGIETRPYESFYDYVESIPAGTSILMNTATVNYRVSQSINKDCKIINALEPTTVMKAKKNEVELENIRKAHVKDAVAMCKFMYWLKTNVGKIPMTEISASDYLEALRREQEGCVDLSFDTIAGYAEHGAIVHYAATKETDVELKPEGLLLVDSGGHYLEGTTDITRTFALGPVTYEMKHDFTLVCRCNMNLAAAKFMYGCCGQNLDYLARFPMWAEGKDFNHGTGHGVGYLLNVHEGPNNFHWRINKARPATILEEGMVTTDEPGIYIEGQYGIRIENELICRKGPKTSYGQFMYFENITYVPVDLDALLPEEMTETERELLNTYHKNVYETVSPYLQGEELAWLKHATREI